VKDLYLPDNARVLTEHGYVALTFDYKGWGESEGPRTRLAPYSRVADAQAALSFLSTLPEADAERLGLYGARQDARAGVAERGHPAVGGDVHRIRARGVHRRYQPRPKAGGRMQESCGLKSGRSTKEFGSDTTRDLNRREPFGRVKIVLAALVDDPKVALPRRVLIRDGSIDLVQLQRSRVPGVLDAHDKPYRAKTTRLARLGRHSACA
jgi:hypothetical protein